ncbi:hypothetical protein LI328DRAFT_167230 [Trichoderma asperelloides]|nr:hypothetical protein LI328DRAFT_167230 [Trichoderma asperelloides]
MAGSISAPALVATFVFGLVVLAASAAIFFFVKANRSPLLRDELRLALVFFLATSTLWGIVEFAATLVPHNATSACQVAISFATVFDQLARFSVEQFLLWGVNGGMKVSKLSLVLQGGLFLRFIIGAIFVGVQRPQFDPVCVATNLILPIGIVVMVVDIAMVMILGTKAFLAKTSDAIRPELSRTNTLVLVTVGLGIWTALSTPLFLGLNTTGLAVRTILPAIGLLILIGIVALTAKSFVPPPSSSGLKIQKTVSIESTVELPTRNLETREFPSQTAMERINASRGIGGLPVEGELFPPMRAQTAPVSAYSKKKMTDRAYKGGKIVISKPIVQMDAETSNFGNIPTIDLATAAMKEKERRELMPQNPFVNVDIGLGKAPSPTELTRKLSAAKRKQVPESAAPSNSRSLLTVDEPAFAMTSAVQLSPGPESARRRSPRHQADRAAPSPPIISPKDEARTPKSAPLQSTRLEEDRSITGAAVSHFSVSTIDPMTARIASTMMFSPERPKSAKAAAPRPPPPPPAPPAPVDHNSVKNNIRPSRQRPPSLPTEEEKPDTKTPLQRRATVGLPNNPRARATRIMFMNTEEDTVPILAAAKMEAEEESEPIPRKSTASASELLGVSLDPALDDFTLLPTPNMPLISPVSVKSLSQSTYGSTSPGSLTKVKTVRRTSFVPDMPVVPVEYQGQQPKISQDPFTDETSTNVWAVAPNEGLARMPSTDKKTRALCVSKFSVDTALTAQEPQSPYQSRLSINTQSSSEEAIGRNSTVVFSSNAKDTRVSTVLNSFSERPTRHESVDSELSLMLRMAPVPPKNNLAEKRSIAQEKSEAEDVPFIIDIPTPESPKSLDSDVQLTVDQLPSWHHRVGEEPPSFSSQLKNRRSRKLLVPKPLALYRPANVTVVIEAEPSPEEPAQEALDKIHEQLRQLDLENGDARATISEKQRQAILANLESEMGAQENQWQTLRVDYSQGSPSTTVSASEINSLRSSVDISKFEIMPITKLNASAGDLLVALKQNAENRLSASSDQLFKEETLESADEKLDRRSLSASGKMNLLSVNTRTMSQIGSPTPPDTDESGAESDTDSMVEGLGTAKDGATALMPRATSFLALDDVLNSSSEDVQSKPNAPVEFEDVSLMTPKAQPAPIVAQPEELKVANVSTAEAETIKFSLADLEEPSPVPVPVPAPAPRQRQVIRRPPRQSKRISTLPDIVENPEPLVGKSGNLGIFQFPWGEKSDSARIPPRMVGISGTMTSGRAPMNSIQEKQLPPAPQTFLDDDFDNGLDAYENEDYDDGFDEATLWEIASLLESDLDASRDDLFIVGKEDWRDQAPAEDELSPASSPVRDVFESVKEEVYDFIPVTLASSESSSDISLQVSTLWTADMKDSRMGLGLPQPSEREWQSYFATAPRQARTVRRVVDEPTQLSSVSLWTAAATEVSMYTSGVWRAPEAKTTTGPALKAVSLVWSLPNPTKISNLGLPQPVDRLWAAYIPEATRTARRTTQMPQPAAIASKSLWSLKRNVKPSVSTGVWTPANKIEAEQLTLTATTAAASVWTPLSRAEPSVWKSYIPVAARPAPKAARMLPPAVIETKSLWKVSSVKPSVSQGVWSPASKEEEEEEEEEETISIEVTPIASLLWSPISAPPSNPWSLPQPDVQVWNAYISSDSRGPRRAPRAQQQQDAIQSTSMWSVEPSRIIEMFSSANLWSLKMTTLLWAPAVSKDAGVGLSQPDAKVWNTYIAMPSRSIHRAMTMSVAESITSTSLWQPLPTVVPYSGGVWAPKSLVAKPSLQSPAKTSLKVVKALWSSSPAETRSIGLQQPDAKIWDLYLLLPARDYRKAYLPRPGVITSTSLWAPAPSVEAPSGGVWKAKSVPLEAESLHIKPVLAAVNDLLWSSSPAKVASFGLPQPKAEFWSAYLVPAGRAQRIAYVPKTVVTITSTSLWAPALSTEVPSNGVWQPKSKPVNVVAKKSAPTSAEAKTGSSLWTQFPSTKPSVGLPQPVYEIWNSYIAPLTSATSTSRRVFVSESTVIESQALWSVPSKTEAAAGYLWCPKQTPAENKRPLTQKIVRAVMISSSPVVITTAAAAATPSPVAESPVSSEETRTANVRKSVPVFMTREQWNSAFKRISQDVKRDDSSLNQWALPSSSSSSSSKNATRLNRSQSVKSRPIFDPSVMALISEYPSTTTTSTSSSSSSRKGLGRSKSISALPSSRRTLSRSNSNKASISLASIPVMEPQPAAFLWTKPALASEKSSDKASMWQQPPRGRADVQPPTFSILLPGLQRRTAGRKADITIPTSFRPGQGLWRGEQIRL